MRNLDKELENKVINITKLKEYGFIKQNNQYIFKTKIYDNQFEIVVILSDKQNISKIIDIENEEEYVLVDIQDSAGEFVGKVREEYENKLQDIVDKCTVPNVFKSEQAKEVIEYIKKKYKDDLEYLWKKFPENAIWRNQTNNKWYGALLVVSERKLEIDSDRVIDILDLRYQKEKIKEIIDNEKVYPGYHMNKESWITIKLDESIETEKIFELIDNSYNISLEK